MRVRLHSKPKPNNYTESKFTIPMHQKSIKDASKLYQIEKWDENKGNRNVIEKIYKINGI